MLLCRVVSHKIDKPGLDYRNNAGSYRYDLNGYDKYMLCQGFFMWLFLDVGCCICTMFAVI